jgi:hypothetical protein
MQQYSAMQALAQRIVYPRGFNRPYRDVVTYIDSYTMEEIANLAWVGGILFHNAPTGARRVYSLLRKILLHYIFGFLDDAQDMMRASRCLWDLAKLLETLVVRSKVSSRFSCTV